MSFKEEDDDTPIVSPPFVTKAQKRHLAEITMPLSQPGEGSSASNGKLKMGSKGELGDNLGWLKESLKSSSKNDDDKTEIPLVTTDTKVRQAIVPVAPTDWE